MSKAPSPLLGFNNNVRHKNRVFHIQTEDSGVKHPHVITHLFMDGGRILKSFKRSYAEHVGVEGMSDIVRQMMKEQHKAMFIALRDGEFDAMFDDGSAAGTPSEPPTAVQTLRKTTGTEGASVSVQSTSANDAAHAAAGAAKEGRDRGSKPPPKRAGRSTPPPPKTATSTVPEIPADPPRVARSGKPVADLTLDVDALERAARDFESGSPLFQRPSDLPPPPQNMFREKERDTGAYRTLPSNEPPPRAVPPPARLPPVPPGTGAMRTASSPPLPSRSATPPPPRPASARPAVPPPEAAKPNDPRYGATRPPAIFAGSKPAKRAPIFGEELISDKSLDEVILSYLAEDLDKK